MSLEIIRFVLGPLQNNTYLAADTESNQAVIIDPSMGVKQALDEALSRDWKISAVWLTHAHFDHIAGIREIIDATSPDIPVRIHPEDIALYQSGGGAADFGVGFHPAKANLVSMDKDEKLKVGKYTAEVRCTPGHTTGHVMIYAPSAQAAFTGDLIFFESIGRTDLAGGDWRKLLKSIETQVMTLPGETRLLPGHGEETTVEHERLHNPFLQELK